jgi:hypothetical protein
MLYGKLDNEKVRAEPGLKTKCFLCDGDLIQNFHLFNHKTYYSFKWKWPRKSWFYSVKPRFFDFGNSNIFEIRKINHLGCGYGVFWNFNSFMKSFLISNRV